LPALVPPLREQQAISALLGALDDKIQVSRRIAEALEEVARGLFKSWFVDFDPVRAIPTVLEHIRRFFPDRLVDSPIGLVPAGWEVVPLGDFVEVTRGLSYTSAGLADQGLPLHNLDSIREGGGYKEDGIKYYVGEFRDRDCVHPGDLIVASTEQGFEHLLIGYAAIVPRSFGDDGLYSQDLCRLRPLDGSSITPRWLYLLLLGHRMHHLVAGYSNGTTVNHLAMDGLRKPLVVIPPREVLKLFDAFVTPMFDQQEAVTAESKTLAELRDTLLPKLISGEIRLPAV
jgi:type I restriction enzyme S subunit